MNQLNFQFFLNSDPGRGYLPEDQMCPDRDVYQLPDMRIDTPAGLRGALDVMFDFGNDEDVALRLGRNVAVGDAVAIWPNPYGQHKYFAFEPCGCRAIEALAAGTAVGFRTFAVPANLTMENVA